MNSGKKKKQLNSPFTNKSTVRSQATMNIESESNYSSMRQSMSLITNILNGIQKHRYRSLSLSETNLSAPINKNSVWKIDFSVLYSFHYLKDSNCSIKRRKFRQNTLNHNKWGLKWHYIYTNSFETCQSVKPLVKSLVWNCYWNRLLNYQIRQ